MSIPALLLLVAIVCLVLSPLLFFGRRLVRYRLRPRGADVLAYQAWERSHNRRCTIRYWMGISGAIVLPLTVAVSGLVLAAGSAYFAGQGDALDAARDWAAKWRSDAAIECQARDTDDNGYVSCTVGIPGGEIRAIECGIDRWYHGWGVTGCRLMKGYSGGQP